MKGPARLKLEADVAAIRPGVVRTTATEWRQAKSRLRHQGDELDGIDKRTVKNLGVEAGVAAQRAIDRTQRRLHEEADLLQRGAEALDQVADAMERAKKALQALGGERVPPTAPVFTPGVPLTDVDHKAKQDYDTALSGYNAGQAADEAAAAAASRELAAAYRSAEAVMLAMLGRTTPDRSAGGSNPSGTPAPAPHGTRVGPGGPLEAGGPRIADKPDPATRVTVGSSTQPTSQPTPVSTTGTPHTHAPSDVIGAPRVHEVPTGTSRDPHVPHLAGAPGQADHSSWGSNHAPSTHGAGSHHGAVTNVAGSTQGSSASFGSATLGGSAAHVGTAAGASTGGALAAGGTGAGALPSGVSAGGLTGLPASGGAASGGAAGVGGSIGGASAGQTGAVSAARGYGAAAARAAVPGSAVSPAAAGTAAQAGAAGSAGSRAAAGAAGGRGAIGGAGTAGAGAGGSRRKAKPTSGSQGEHLVFAQDWIDDEATAPEVLN